MSQTQKIILGGLAVLLLAVVAIGFMRKQSANEGPAQSTVKQMDNAMSGTDVPTSAPPVNTSTSPMPTIAIGTSGAVSEDDLKSLDNAMSTSDVKSDDLNDLAQ